MSVPLQNPDATDALVELYDIVGRLQLRLDETISPIAVADDGWARVTYEFFGFTQPASTGANDRVLFQADPNHAFKLLYIECRGTGGVTGSPVLKLDPVPAVASVWGTLRFNDFTLDGLTDPETHDSLQILGGMQPVAPPNCGWDLRTPATGVGQTFEIRAVVAKIPARMYPHF